MPARVLAAAALVLTVAVRAQLEHAPMQPATLSNATQRRRLSPKKCTSDAQCAEGDKLPQCFSTATGKYCLTFRRTPRHQVEALRRFRDANTAMTAPGGCLATWVDSVDPCDDGKQQWNTPIPYPEGRGAPWAGVMCCRDSADYVPLSAKLAAGIKEECPFAGVIGLYLSACGLQWSDALAELGALRALELDGNALERVPSAIARLGNLTQLTLSNNHISYVSDRLGGLKLNSLHLSGNRLTAMPGAIASLRSLQDLALDRNKLEVVPDSIGNLSRLTQLNLAENRLAGTLTSGLRMLRKLQYLDLSANLVTNLPVGVGQLIALKQLKMNDNRLRELPASLSQLTALSSVYVHNNDLRALPPLANQTSLQFLSAYNNTISQLPEALPATLRHLYLAGNPLVATSVQLAAWLGSTAQTVEWLDISAAPAKTIYYTSYDQCGDTFDFPEALFEKPRCLPRIDIDSGSPSAIRERQRTADGLVLPLVCRVHEPCSFTVHLRDTLAFPVKFGGEMLAMSTASMDSTVDLRDNHDGTYTGELPRSWLQSVSSGYNIQLMRSTGGRLDTAMRPFYTALTTTSDPRCSPASDAFFQCPLLVVVNPPNCTKQLGQHAMVNPADNSTCMCRPGSYLTEGTCIVNCPRNQQRSGDRCHCMRGTYNYSRFRLRFHYPQGRFNESIGSCVAEYHLREPQPAVGDLECRACPQQCISCEGVPGVPFDGVPTIAPGWRIVSPHKSCIQASADLARNSTACAVRPASSHAAAPAVSILRCEGQGHALQQHCPSYRLDAACPSCSNNHGGILCQNCGVGYARMGVSCRPCTESARSIYLRLMAHSAWAVPVLGCVAVLYLLSLYLELILPIAIVVVGCTAIGICLLVLLWVLLVIIFGWAFAIAILAVLFFVALLGWRYRDLKEALWCNFRILFGLAQVLSLLHNSLAVEFPDPFGTVAAASGVLSIDASRLLVVLELECIPEFGFYHRWLAVVLGLPGLALVIVLLQLGYDKSLFRHSDRYLSAFGRLCTRMVYCQQYDGGAVDSVEMLHIGEASSREDSVRRTDLSSRHSAEIHAGAASTSTEIAPARLPRTEQVSRLHQMGFTRDMADHYLSLVDGDEPSALKLLLAARASQNWKRMTVNIVFVLFAPTSAAIVKLFQCRQLGPDLSVLAEDNTVPCCDEGYRMAWWLATLLFVLVPFGVPSSIVVWMIKNYRDNHKNLAHHQGQQENHPQPQQRRRQQQQQQQQVQPRLPPECRDGADVPLLRSHDRSSGCCHLQDWMPNGGELDFVAHLRNPNNPYNVLHFSFIIDDYRPEYFFFEPIDLVRKFSLTALPRLISYPGSASQRLLVLLVSAMWCALQLAWLPYRHGRSNVLKMLADVNIFVFIAVASWLKSEQQSGYGDSVTESIASLLLIAFTSFVVGFALRDSCGQAKIARRQQSHVGDASVAATIRVEDWVKEADAS